MPYSRVNLSYCGGHYKQQLCFYGGHFIPRGFGCFCQNDGILMRKLKCDYGCRIPKYFFKRLGKVVMSHNLLVFEVMNKHDQGSKAPSTSPFSQLKIEPPMYSKQFVSITRVLELLWSYKRANTEL